MERHLTRLPPPGGNHQQASAEAGQQEKEPPGDGADLGNPPRHVAVCRRCKKSRCSRRSLWRAVGGGADHVAVGFLLSFDHRHSLVGHPVPAAGFCSPHGRPTRQRLDLDGVSTFQAVLLRPVRSLRPPLAPSSRGQVLSPRFSSHLPKLSVTRRHQGFTRVHPPGLPPRLVDPLDGTGAVGLLPGLRTPAGRTCGARQGGGRASSTRPELYDRHRRTPYP
jgi:hypothetical protein